MSATFDSIRPRPIASWNVRQRAVGVAPTSRLFVWSLRALCGAALIVTGYLAVTALRSEDVAGCGSGGVWDCGHALHSRWSKAFGMPVSVPAFGLYLTLMAALAVCRPKASAARLRNAWGVVTVGAVTAGLAAAWFVSLQVFVLGHLCVYCVTAHSCALALCAAVLWKRPLGTRTTVMLSCVSLVAVGTLIGGQLFAAPPQTFKIEHYPETDAQVSPEHSSAPVPESRPSVKEPVPDIFQPPDADSDTNQGNDP